jgi:hypothetical protein
MAAVVALALLVAACGDDDGGADGQGLSSSEQAVADVLAVSIADDDPANPFGGAEAAQCISEGMVGELGIARLAEIGITAGSLGIMTDAEVDSVAELALGCIDVETAMADQFATDGISQESARCMSAGFAETDFFKQAFIAGFTGDDSYDPSQDPEFLGSMITIATECLTDEELQIIMGG